MGLCYTLEEGIVVGVEVDARQDGRGGWGRMGRRLLVRVVLENLFAIYNFVSGPVAYDRRIYGLAILICSGVAL